MFKDVLNHMADAHHYASVGLVIFFTVFVLTAANALLRSRKDVAAWSRLPLANDDATNTPEARS